MSGKPKGDKRPDWSSFHGRATRAEWFKIVLQMVAGSILLSAFAPGIAPLPNILLLLVIMATSARRLHDLRLSGWLQTIPMCLTAAALVSIYAVHGALNVDAAPRLTLNELTDPGTWRSLDGQKLLDVLPEALFALGGLACLGLCGVLLLAPGDAGPNCFGEND